MRGGRPFLVKDKHHAVGSQCSWIETLCRQTLLNPKPSRQASTAALARRWRCSFASPCCAHAGQLPPHQSQTYPLLPKSLDLYVDVCEHTIDLLTRDREPDQPPVNYLPDSLTVHHAHRVCEIHRIGRCSLFPSLTPSQFRMRFFS
jgi:hypothetical protein